MIYSQQMQTSAGTKYNSVGDIKINKSQFSLMAVIQTDFEKKKINRRVYHVANGSW